MKLALIITGNDAETVWNAFRYGAYAAGQGETVTAFLLGKGVEAERIGDARFDVRAQMQRLLDAGGTIRACGTCLELRGTESAATCPVSTLADLHQMVVESDRVLTF